MNSSSNITEVLHSKFIIIIIIIGIYVKPALEYVSNKCSWNIKIPS